MGVPGLFGYCLKKFGNSLNLKKIDKKIDILFIDGNGFIYNAVHNIIDSQNTKVNKANELYNLIYKETLKLLTDVVDDIKPNKVYLTFDGVAPMAKIHQQRSRRYKKKYEEEFKENLREKYNKAPNRFNNIWSDVLITPGTEFMKQMNEFFVKEFSDKKNYIFNGSDIPGEGEHKILNYIRQSEDKNKNYMVHGLDGDLIFLLMALDIKDLKNNQIYIYREMEKGKTVIKSFLDINDLKIKFKNHITELVKTDNEYFEFNENNLIDFIFICLFIGNDFLPCQRFIDIYNEGLDLLISIYIKTVLEFKNIITLKEDKLDFNILALYKFIQYSALSEYEEFTKAQENRNKNVFYKIMQLKRKYDNIPNLYEKEIFKFEHNNLNIKNFMDLSNSFDDYRFEVYRHFTKSVSDQKGTINKICEDYLLMLKWNIEYYLFGCIDWFIYYHYPISPFFTDLMNYISNNNVNINQYPKIINKPLNANTQLLICIPKKYLKLYIPEVFNMINIKNSWMFPDTYGIDRTNQIFLYKSYVMIPNVDFKQL